MLDDLEPIVRDAVMKILAAIFETGFVKEVNLSVVYALFGVGTDAEDDITVDFTDPRWMEEYIRFSEDLPEDAEVFSIKLDGNDENVSVSEQLRSHLLEAGVPEDDIAEIEQGVLSTIAEHDAEEAGDDLTKLGPGPNEKIH